MFLVRVRSLLARHPAIYWIAVGSIVIAVAAAAWSAMTAVDHARRSWGERRTVWIASADVDAGGTVVATPRELPIVAIPPGAIAAAPTDRIAVHHIGAGEVITASDLGDGLASVLPDGWRALAVPTDPARLPAVAGDRVAVYSDGIELADDGIVLDVTDGVVTVGVPVADAGAVSAAARDQTAMLALRRP